MRIEQLMSQPAITCTINDTLSAAAQLMWEHDCGVMPVVGTDGRLTGILTDRDICMAGYTRGQPLHEIPVSAAMSSQVFSCSPQESIDAAERLMSKMQVRRVPVVDRDNRPIGVLSLNDLARHAAAARSGNGLERETVETLAAICRPRARPPQIVHVAGPAPIPTGM
jgi:CBS domain-containing protein